jgi:hypothetical protein
MTNKNKRLESLEKKLVRDPEFRTGLYFRHPNGTLTDYKGQEVERVVRPTIVFDSVLNE